jgi:hypothetical protein
MRSHRHSPIPEQVPILALGSPPACVCVYFLRSDAEDPLARFPALRTGDRPYNRWLTERILERAIEDWGRRGPTSGQIPGKFDAGCELALGAFAEVLPAAIGAGDSAVLAALAVTANLVRTLLFLGEALAEGDPGAAIPRPLSRVWCGLAPDAEPADRPAGGASVLDAGPARPDRRGLRELASALAISPAAVERSFAEAIGTLRGEIGSGGHFTAGDFRELQTTARRGAIRRSSDFSGSGE